MSPLPLGVLGSAHVEVAGGDFAWQYRGYSAKVDNGSNPHTYESAPIGTAGTGRTVLAQVCSWSPGQRNITGVTIGGVTAVADENNYGDDIYSMWRAVVETGTTADIVVTCDDTTNEINIGVWTANKPVEKVFSTSFSVPLSSSSTNITATTTENGGFLIAGHCTRGSSNSTTWTNATERYDTPTAQPTSGADAATAGGSHQVNLNFTNPTDNAQMRLGIVAYKELPPTYPGAAVYPGATLFPNG